MYIENLEVSNVRNLIDVQIETSPGINFFFGENAAGKTAVLESIHLLSRTKSFRSNRFADVLSHGQDRLIVTTELLEKGRKITTGIYKKRGETALQFDGNRVKKTSDQARNIPIFIITTESHKILNSGPKTRRHWLDWSLFHVEHDYMTVWQQYYLALRHRNALLRQCSNGKQFDAWEDAMATTAEKISGYRENYIKCLQTTLNRISNATFSDIEIKVNGHENLKQELSQSREQDKKLGYTRPGPHSTDIQFNLNGRPIKSIFSRGQAKLFLIHLISSQVIEFIEKNNKKPVLMVDDIAAELDSAALEKTLENLVALDTQVFINSVLRDTVDRLAKEAAMFHVERGKVRKMVE